MSIRNYTINSVQPWKDVYCNEMNCDQMNVQTITIQDAEVDNLVVNESLTGTAEIHNMQTLPDTTQTFLEQGETLQMMNVEGIATGKILGDIRTFHCACDATGVGGFPNQAYSGVQNTSNMTDQVLTLHVVDGADNYSLLQVCNKGSDSTSVNFSPTAWSVTSDTIVAQGTTLIDDMNGATIGCGPSIAVQPFDHGSQLRNINGDHETNVFAGTNALYPSPIADASLITYRNLNDNSFAHVLSSYDTGTNEPYVNIHVNQGADDTILDVRKDEINFNTASSTFQQTTMLFPGYSEGAMYISSSNEMFTLKLQASQASDTILNVNRINTPVQVDTFYQIVGNVIQCYSYCQVEVLVGAGVPAFIFGTPVPRNFNFAALSDIHGGGTSTDTAVTASGVNVVVEPVVGQERIQVSLPGSATGQWLLKFNYSYLTF